MPLFINFVCDLCPKESPTGLQRVGFERLDETCADLFAAMPTIGWHLETEGAQVKLALCRDCAVRGGKRIELTAEQAGAFAAMLEQPPDPSPALVSLLAEGGGE